MMTSLKVHVLTAREEFDAVVEVEWAAMYEPFRPEFPWIYPVFGHTEEDRKASMRAAVDRRWRSHAANPASHWIYITDGHGRVVGVTNWLIHTTNPFPNGPVRVECNWFPEGDTRDFVTCMLNQGLYGRMNWMDRPHISFNAMGVLPEMRGQGVGSLLMQWGMRKAEELDLECFVEASPLGRDLYEKFDFQVLMSVGFNMHRKNPSQAWIRMQDQFSPVFGTLMWRPAPTELQKGSASFWDMLKGRRPSGQS